MSNERPEDNAAPPDSDAFEPAAQQVGPGAQLMAERRAQGLSLGDVARQLKLSVRQVEALERDDYAGFSGPVFVRGFLRNYAKLLRVDPEALVLQATIPAAAASAGAVQPSVAIPLQEPPPDRGRRVNAGALLGTAVVLVLVLAALYETHRKPTPPPLPLAVAPGSQAESPPATAVEAGGTRSPIPSAPPPSSAPAPSSTPPVGVATTPAAAPASPASVVEAPPASPPPAAAPSPPPPVTPVEVKLSFDGESWVEIKDRSGAVLMSRLNVAGTERVVRGEPPFELVIGNAQSVRVSFRNRPVDLAPHTRVDVARVTLE